MKSVLIVAPKEEETRLIRESLPAEYQAQNADSFAAALTLDSHGVYDVIFSDLKLLKDTPEADTVAGAIRLLKDLNPQAEILILSSKTFIRDTIKAVKAGAKSYLTYPIDPTEIRNAVESVDRSLTQNMELDYLRDQFWKTEWLDVIRTRNPAMREALKKIRAVAPTIATALLTGETGTGKGLIARVIHRHSNRSENPFIRVHCGAIPETLLESELFGHEKGAFTGAIRKKPGKFELARGGTIFLDEIGTVCPSAQIKLLQVMQDGTFSRVGGEEILTTDARVISATNADLARMCDRGEFRKDLYFRLNVFPINIPPLRERIEDIEFLSDVFLNNLNRKYGKNIQSLHPLVVRAFKNYHWPGNIRELENLMERAYILETGTELTPSCYPAELFDSTGGDVMPLLPVDARLPLSEARRLAIDGFERQYLEDLLTRNKGKVSRTAKDAGVSTRQLNKLMVKYGIRKEAFKE